MQGIIKVIKSNYGFISSEGKDWFFHESDFNGFFGDLVIDFNKKQKIEVKFDTTKSSKGNKAINIKRLDYPNQVEGGV